MKYSISLYSTLPRANEKILLKKINENYSPHLVQCLKIVRGFYIQGSYSKKIIQQTVKQVILDPLVEKFLLNQLIGFPYQQYLEIFFKSGVVDNLARILKSGMQDFLKKEFDENTIINSTTWFLFQGKNIPSQQLFQVANDFLFNPLIQNFKAAKINQRRVPIAFPVELAGPLLVSTNLDRVSQQVKKIKSKITDDKKKYYQIIKISQQKKEFSYLQKLSKKKNYFLSLKEMQVIASYFKKAKIKKDRAKSGLPLDPTDVEMEVIAQTWSEHCKHKIFSAKINYFQEGKKLKKINSLYKTYIKKTTFDLMKKRQDLLSVFLDNAGIFVFNKKYAVAMKVETHNSPSAIEPYGGAITGILGVNRDILGTGKGALPIFNTNVLCFADPNYSKKLPKNILSPKKIFQGVHRGIEKGGNQSGIPTINGAIVFDNSFLGKPLVFCGTAGILPRKIKQEFTHQKKINSGDLIVMVGGRIGKDGIHGATFSSSGLKGDFPISVVQIGDSFTQKKMTDFLMVARNKNLYKTLTDNGAGGLSSSVGEMATICNGAEIHLDRALLKYPDLKPWEIMISESQERMTLAVNSKKIVELKKLIKLYDCELCVLGEFKSHGYFKAYYANQLVLKLDLKFLHFGNPQLQLTAYYKKKKNPNPVIRKVDINNFFLKLIQRKNIASKEHWVRQYDHEVKAGTILKPFDGVNVHGPMDGGVFKPTLESNEKQGLVIANGVIPRYSQIDAYGMTLAAVDEGVRNYVACGGNPYRMYGLDNFCWPDPIQSSDNPDGKEKLGQLVRSNMALREILLAYNLPLISGKDSMKNDYGQGKKKISALPTLLFTVIGIIPDVQKTMTTFFKQDDSVIYLLGDTYPQLGASEGYAELGYIGESLPPVYPKKNFQLYLRLFFSIQNELILTCHDISDGGLAVALAESAWGGEKGVKVNLDLIQLKTLVNQKKHPHDDTISSQFIKLFSESSGRFIIEVAKPQVKKFEKFFSSTLFQRIGNTQKKKLFTIDDQEKVVIEEKLETLFNLWRNPLVF